MNTGIGRHMANSSRFHFPIIKFSNLIIIISYWGALPIPYITQTKHKLGDYG